MDGELKMKTVLCFLLLAVIAIPLQPQILSPISANVAHSSSPGWPASVDFSTGMDGEDLDTFEPCFDTLADAWTLVYHMAFGGVRLSPGTMDPSYAVWTCGTPADDQYAEVLIGYANGGGTYRNGPMVRASLVADTGYGCEVTTNGTIYIREHTAGTVTTLNTASYTATSGDVIRMSAVGTSLSCDVNGTPTVTATDGSITSGVPAIYATGSAINLYVTFAADDI